MKKLLVLSIFLFACSAKATTIYVSQSGGVFGGGTACNGQTAISIASFNAATLTAGEIVYLCGTITTAVNPNNGGVAGNPVLVQWDTGASVQVCSTTAAVNIGSLSYVTFDLGGNATAVECPNNGIGLGTQINAIGFGDGGNGWDHIEIRNGTIGPMFVYSGTTNQGFNSTCINGGYGPSYTHIHHVTLSGCAFGINHQNVRNTDGDEFDHITAGTSVGSFIYYGNGDDGNYTASNAKIHDNDLNYSTVWAVPGGYLHYEWLHVYNRGPDTGSQDKMTNLQIYNNYFHGSSPNNSGSTGGIVITEGLSNCSPVSYLEAKIFNNLIVDAGGGIGFSSGGGGYIYEQDCEHIVSVYNNTIIGSNNTINSCFEFSGSTGDVITIKDNICQGAWAAYYNWSGNTPPTTANYNDFFNIGNGGYYNNGTSYSTLAAWTAATGRDANSIITNPNLNAGYVPNAGSPVIGLGANLTSLGITLLDNGAPQSFGIIGACGTGCLARPAVGNWDTGAYPFSSSPPPPTTYVPQVWVIR